MPTVTSDTAICNMALLDLGHQKITAIGEATTAGEMCEIYYGPTRDALLRTHPWNFAIKRETLAAQSTAPNHEYDYAYPLPADFIRMIRTNLEAEGYDDGDWRIEYVGSTKCLVSNETTVKIEYVARVEDVAQYDPLFVQILAKMLAVAMCMKLADNASLKSALADELRELAPGARLADATDSTPREIVGYDWVTSRS